MSFFVEVDLEGPPSSRVGRRLKVPLVFIGNKVQNSGYGGVSVNV